MYVREPHNIFRGRKSPDEIGCENSKKWGFTHFHIGGAA